MHNKLEQPCGSTAVWKGGILYQMFDYPCTGQPKSLAVVPWIKLIWTKKSWRNHCPPWCSPLCHYLIKGGNRQKVLKNYFGTILSLGINDNGKIWIKFSYPCIRRENESKNVSNVFLKNDINYILIFCFWQKNLLMKHEVEI